MKKSLMGTTAALLIALSACGYSFRGGQSNLPADIKTVAIPTFVNRTSEARIETVLTDQVIYQFTRSKLLTLVGQDQADAVLKGVINRVDVLDVALTTQETSKQRRVFLVIEAKLVRAKGNEVIWNAKSLQQWRTYNVSGDPQADQLAKQRALSEAAEELAETVHDRVFENF